MFVHCLIFCYFVLLQGTLVRVRDVIKNEPLAEFRRGADMAVIN